MKTLKFKIDDVKLVEVSDTQNALLEVKVCHTGMNLHEMPISLETLKSAEKTIVNKWLVAGWDGQDFEGHEPDQRIIGFFPKENNFRYEEKDGKTYFIANAIISKLYADWAFDVFEKDNFRECSMEATIIETQLSDGFDWITSYVYQAVTVLGKMHRAAMPGSGASLQKFSEQELVDIRDKVIKTFSKDNDKDKEDEKVKFNKEKFAVLFSEELCVSFEGILNAEEISAEDVMSFAKEATSKEFTEVSAARDEATEKLSAVEQEKKDCEDKIAELEVDKTESETKFAEITAELVKEKAEKQELIEFKAGVEKQAHVDKVEFAITSVSEDLTQEQIDEWRAKETNGEFDTVASFDSAIKAFAYEISKGKAKPGDGDVRVALPQTKDDSQKDESKSVWERI